MKMPDVSRFADLEPKMPTARVLHMRVEAVMHDEMTWHRQEDLGGKIFTRLSPHSDANTRSFMTCFNMGSARPRLRVVPKP